MLERFAGEPCPAGRVAARDGVRGQVEHRPRGFEARADREEGGQAGLELPLRRVPPPLEPREAAQDSAGVPWLRSSTKA